MEITIQGTAYKAQKPDANTVHEMVKWASTKLESPLSAIKDSLAGLPPYLQEMAVREAIREARTPKSLADQDIADVFCTKDGIIRLMTVAFGKDQPDLKEEQLWELFMAGVKEHGEAFLKSIIS